LCLLMVGAFRKCANNILCDRTSVGAFVLGSIARGVAG
jgi:hypothetical protein